jgi:hypothetical protein
MPQNARHTKPVLISWILTSLNKSAARWCGNFKAAPDWVDWMQLPYNNGFWDLVKQVWDSKRHKRNLQLGSQMSCHHGEHHTKPSNQDVSWLSTRARESLQLQPARHGCTMTWNVLSLLPGGKARDECIEA